MNARRRTAGDYRMIAAPQDPQHTLKPARLICAGEGFAMVRRAGESTVPFVIGEDEWLSASAQTKGER